MSDATSNATSGNGTALKKYYGKYAGIVLRRAMQEGDPSHRGTLVVQVPGILEEDPTGLGERAAEVLALPSFLPGFFFIPEEQEKVWVEFVAGNINAPIWSGMWYPVDATPANVDGSRPTEFQKVIRTATGHVMQLDDTSGSEQLVIKDGTNGNTVTMNQTGVEVKRGNNTIAMTSSGITMTDSNGNSIALDANGIKLTAGAGKAVKIETAMAKVHVNPANVKVSDATGSPQLVALKPFVDWAQAHQHVGNMGAPTPPFPTDMAQLIAQVLAGMFVSGTAA